MADLVNEVSDLYHEADIVAQFCRIQMNIKRDLPVRSSEMGLLIFLTRYQGKVTPVEIAGFFKVSKPMVTTMVNALESKGYLVKEPSPQDKRSVTLIITKEGLELVSVASNEFTSELLFLKNEMGESKFNALIKLRSEERRVG